jgi:hypothetical protein
MPFVENLNTTSGYTTYGSILGGSLPIFGLTLVGVIILGIFLSWLSFSWFKRWFKFLSYFGKSFTYFLKGTLVVIGSASIYGLYWILSSLSEQGIIPVEYYLYAICGYFGISGLGYVADKWYQRMRQYKKKVK